MSVLLAATTRLVSPDHLMFGIADGPAIADLAEPDLPVPGHHWLGVNPSEVLIQTGQDRVAVTLRLQLWDGLPPPPPGHPEVTDTITLTLPTGKISIDRIAAGWEHDILELPPGRYGLRLTGWNRGYTRHQYTRLSERFDTGDHPTFHALRNALIGKEHYLAQFWPYTTPQCHTATRTNKPH